MRDKLARVALRTSLAYAALAALWILLSDEVMMLLVSDRETIREVSTVKGWVFVAVTAALLFILLRAQLYRWGRESEARQRAESLMRESELRLRSAVQNSPAVLFIVDRDGIFRLSEGQALVKLGLKPGQVVGQSALELYKDVPSVMHSLRLALGGAPARTINEFPGVTFDTAYSPLFDRDGRPDGLIGVAIDITERMRAEEAHTRLATAVEQAAEAIVITDINGTISYVNPAFEKTTGYTRQEAVGNNPRILRSGRHDKEFYRQMWECLGRGEVWSGHIVNRRKSGALYEEEMTISPVHDATGKVVSYVAVKRDVTRVVALEEQVRQSQKMEAIGRLAGGVAHDFNNILGVIQMQAGLLKMDSRLSPAELEYVTEISRAAERAANLTQQLLLFSRRQAIQPQDVNLNDIVANITKMLRRILGEDIEMQFKYSGEPLFIHADPGMMDQVLLNLAVNSRDAMPKGGLMIVETDAIEVDEFFAPQHPRARPGPFVCLSVSDNGVGMSPEVLPRIFEPFFTTKEAGKGTGLGLATVFGIVEQHQGWIQVSSQLEVGTTFRVYLPRLPSTNRPAPPRVLFETLPRGNETILLVEDDLSLRELVRSVLTRLGYRVLEASTAISALEVWKQHRDTVRLLLTDMVMPERMTGRELAQRLLQENPRLRVIYTSGYSPEIAGRNFPLEEGVNFLPKPFQTSKLATTVRACLDSAVRPS